MFGKNRDAVGEAGHRLGWRGNLDYMDMRVKSVRFCAQPRRVADVDKWRDGAAVLCLPGLDDDLSRNPGWLTHGERERLAG
jgi:hypothetical protein